MAALSWLSYRRIFIDSCDLFITMVELVGYSGKLSVYMELIDKINYVGALPVQDAMTPAKKKGANPSRVAPSFYSRKS
jgi:hypothetical protein